MRVDPPVGDDEVEVPRPEIADDGADVVGVETSGPTRWAWWLKARSTVGEVTDGMVATGVVTPGVVTVGVVIFGVVIVGIVTMGVDTRRRHHGVATVGGS